MIKRFEIFLLIILFSIVFTPIVNGSDYEVNTDAQSYIIKKLKTHHIVFLGTVHKKPAIHKFLLEIIPTLNDAGVTHIGLEIAFDQQAKIDNFIQSGKKLANIRIHPDIDGPGYRKLLIKLAALDPNIRPKTIALDQPKSRYRGKISRTKWMAGSIVQIFHKNPKAKILVVVDNFHVLKVLNWQENSRNQYKSICHYLKSMIPEFRIFSISQLVDEDPEKCDFTAVFGAVNGSVVIDCDHKFDGWKFGPASKISIKPTETCDLVDGLIIY
ncbi:MAG: hypothetical protein SWH54_17215 [Thermodesulfobacteriota bacterium]|nr:hypothetical protein [Thermodesulfobacteriota bacterium]